eukprot:4024975-Amphidinium_carterae.4
MQVVEFEDNYDRLREVVRTTWKQQKGIKGDIARAATALGRTRPHPWMQITLGKEQEWERRKRKGQMQRQRQIMREVEKEKTKRKGNTEEGGKVEMGKIIHLLDLRRPRTPVPCLPHRQGTDPPPERIVEAVDAWLFSIKRFCAEVESPGYKSSLRIDSGSEIHVCPPSFCARCPWTDHRNVVARTAGGHYGEKLVRFKTTRRLVDRGYTIEIPPKKGCIRSAKGADIPLRVTGGTYVLPLTTNGQSHDDKVKVRGEMWVAAGVCEERLSFQKEQHRDHPDQLVQEFPLLRAWVGESILVDDASPLVDRMLIRRGAYPNPNGNYKDMSTQPDCVSLESEFKLFSLSQEISLPRVYSMVTGSVAQADGQVQARPVMGPLAAGLACMQELLLHQEISMKSWR